MFNNKSEWLDPNKCIPPVGLLVKANVKTYGVLNMSIVTINEVDNSCAFSPSLWEKPNEIYWKEENSNFICKNNVIDSWCYIPDKQINPIFSMIK